jgi:hypothetical protein
MATVKLPGAGRIEGSLFRTLAQSRETPERGTAICTVESSDRSCFLYLLYHRSTAAQHRLEFSFIVELFSI